MWCVLSPRGAKDVTTCETLTRSHCMSTVHREVIGWGGSLARHHIASLSQYRSIWRDICTSCISAEGGSAFAPGGNASTECDPIGGFDAGRRAMAARHGRMDLGSCGKAPQRAVPLGDSRNNTIVVLSNSNLPFSCLHGSEDHTRSSSARDDARRPLAWHRSSPFSAKVLLQEQQNALERGLPDATEILSALAGCGLATDRYRDSFAVGHGRPAEDLA
jgi:hypothetical protein